MHRARAAAEGRSSQKLPELYRSPRSSRLGVRGSGLESTWEGALERETIAMKPDPSIQALSE